MKTNMKVISKPKSNQEFFEEMEKEDKTGEGEAEDEESCWPCGAASAGMATCSPTLSPLGNVIRSLITAATEVRAEEVLQGSVLSRANNDERLRRVKWIDIFPKETYKWPTGPWKDAQHHSSPGKHKSIRYHLTPVRVAVIKSQKISVVEHVSKDTKKDKLNTHI